MWKDAKEEKAGVKVSEEVYKKQSIGRYNSLYAERKMHSNNEKGVLECYQEIQKKAVCSGANKWRLDKAFQTKLNEGMIDIDGQWNVRSGK